MSRKTKDCNLKPKQKMLLEEDRDIETIKSNFSCAICLSITEEPCMTPCGHLFCNFCLMQWIKSSPEPFCPKCRTFFGVDSIIHISNGYSGKNKNEENIIRKILKPGFACQSMRFGNLIICKATSKKPLISSILITMVLCLILMILTEIITTKL